MQRGLQFFAGTDVVALQDLLDPAIAIMQRTNSFRDKFERCIVKDRQNTYLRRKACTAIAAKMARTVHGIIKHGEPYRPFFEG